MELVHSKSIDKTSGTCTACTYSCANTSLKSAVQMNLGYLSPEEWLMYFFMGNHPLDVIYSSFIEYATLCVSPICQLTSF